MRRDKGSVLIIAMVMTAVLFSIGLAFASIIEKEVVRQHYSIRSQRAFAVADIAWECALYNDFRRLVFSEGGGFSGRARFSCGDDGNVKVRPPEEDSFYTPTERIQKSSLSSRFSSNTGAYNFVVVHEGSEADVKPCADVSVQKRCVLSSGDSDCSDSEVIETRVVVVGYDSCSLDGSTEKRGDVRRRFVILY